MKNVFESGWVCLKQLRKKWVNYLLANFIFLYTPELHFYFIMFYDFNSFPAPVKLPSYLLEYESIQETSRDEVINVFGKSFQSFPVTPLSKRNIHIGCRER